MTDADVLVGRVLVVVVVRDRQHDDLRSENRLEGMKRHAAAHGGRREHRISRNRRRDSVPFAEHLRVAQAIWRAPAGGLPRRRRFLRMERSSGPERGYRAPANFNGYSLQPVHASRYRAAAERPHEASEPLQVRAVIRSAHVRWPGPSQQMPTQISG